VPLKRLAFSEKFACGHHNVFRMRTFPATKHTCHEPSTRTLRRWTNHTIVVTCKPPAPRLTCSRLRHLSVFQGVCSHVFQHVITHVIFKLFHDICFVPSMYHSIRYRPDDTMRETTHNIEHAAKTCRLQRHVRNVHFCFLPPLVSFVLHGRGLSGLDVDRISRRSLGHDSL
jgi:hypothetical protein